MTIEVILPRKPVHCFISPECYTRGWAPEEKVLRLAETMSVGVNTVYVLKLPSTEVPNYLR